MKFFTIYFTTKDTKEAEKIATVLVEENLAACVSILPSATSVYRWEGSTRKEQEVIVLAKTTQSKRDRAIQRIKDLHSYQIPSIVAWPIVDGDKDYLEWINTQLK